MRIYYHETARMPVSYPALTGAMRADVAIIGGGLTGLSAALELAKAGLKPIVLEADKIGSGASGRNGGHVCTDFVRGMEPIEAKLGMEPAKQLWALADAAPKLVAERVKDYKIECGLKWGYLHAAAYPHHLKDLQAMRTEWQRYGYEDHALLDRDAFHERVASPIYHGGVWEGGAGHLQPLDYCHGLARAAQAEGATLYEQSKIIRIEDKPRPILHTDQGQVEADFVLIAGNAYLTLKNRKLSPFLVRIGSYILASEPLGEEKAAALIPNGEAVADSNVVLDYFRIDGDTRLVFGGRATYSGFEPTNLEGFIHKRLRHVFPQLASLKADYVWGGNIGLTLNRMPHFGRLQPNIYFVQGFSGHGVAFSQIAGKVLAEAIRGHAEQFDLLAQFKPLPFLGGPFRQILLAMGMLYYRLRERFDF